MFSRTYIHAYICIYKIQKRIYLYGVTHRKLRLLFRKVHTLPDRQIPIPKSVVPDRSHGRRDSGMKIIKHRDDIRYHVCPDTWIWNELKSIFHLSYVRMCTYAVDCYGKIRRKYFIDLNSWEILRIYLNLNVSFFVTY